MTDDLTKIFTEFVEQAERTVTEGSKKLADRIDESSKKLADRIDAEKQKAEIRAEIGHLSRDLSKAYELLGREYYNLKISGTPFTDEEGLFDRISSKEKLIDLYNEKLDRLEE